MFDGSRQGITEQAVGAQIRPLTLRENLTNSRERATAEIQRVDRLLELLDKNPEFDEMLQLLSNTRF